MKEDFEGVDVSRAYQHGPMYGNDTVAYNDFCGLARLFDQIKPKVVVEVGVLTGKTTLFMAALRSDAQLFPVDPWEIQPEQQGLQLPYPMWDCFRANVVKLGYEDRIHPIRKLSVDAAREWGEDDSPPIDLIYIDAGHTAEAVEEDIRAWWPHVRVGGVMAGDDLAHMWPGVQVGVERVFGNDYNLDEPFWWKFKTTDARLV